MTGEGFGGTERRNYLTEEPTHSSSLRGVVIGCAGSVGIDIIHLCGLDMCHRESLLHCEERSFSIIRRSGLMERITGIAVPVDICQYRCFALQRRVLRLHDHICGSFAEIESFSVR